MVSRTRSLPAINWFLAAASSPAAGGASRSFLTSASRAASPSARVWPLAMMALTMKLPGWAGRSALELISAAICFS